MKILEKITIPHDNVNDEEVIIKNIYVKNDDLITEGTLLLDYETSKANFEIECTKPGYVTSLINEGDRAKVGQEIIFITDEKGYKHSLAIENSITKIEQTFSKKAQLKVNECKIDKAVFKGQTLITEKMVLEYLQKQDQNNNIDQIHKIPSNKLSEIDNLTNKNRNGLVSTVTKSFDAIAIDTDSIYSMREFKGSLSILIIKIVSELLSRKQYRHLNSFVNDKEFLLVNEINFGLALNLGSGLKVGVIKDANSLDINDIEKKLLNLIDKYIDEKLGINDVSGATVVLTDLTNNQIDNFHPLILKNNSIMIGLSGRMQGEQTITISFDHRVTDGQEMAIFLNTIIKNLVEKYPNFENINVCYKCLINLKDDKKLNTPGLIKVLTHEKEERFICLNCLQGY